MPITNIVVVGAGVAGLTTALLLAKQKRFSITIVAKHMPGDYDIEYSSPWAGANVVPVSVADTREMQWDIDTFHEMWRLAKDEPGAGIHAIGLTKYFQYSIPDPWYKNLFPEFRVIPQGQLPSGVKSGIFYQTMCVNTALYLPWLASQCLANGVVLKRGVITSIDSASSLHHSGTAASVVVNCTGLLAHKLGGLGPDGKGDKHVGPVRGQIVLVRNEIDTMIELSAPAEGGDEMTYIMTRAAGGGTILGGCYQKGNWESQPDPNLAQRIMARAVDLYPDLANGKGVEGLDILRHAVGLRPVREGGTRLEASRVNDVLVVHNYGHGGFGYQCSYGSAAAAVKVVEDILTSSTRVSKEETF